MMVMEQEVITTIVEALREKYGDEFVELVDGNIYVTDEEANGACEISIRYAE